MKAGERAKLVAAEWKQLPANEKEVSSLRDYTHGFQTTDTGACTVELSETLRSRPFEISPGI